jgi:hypothetical protein
MAAMYSPPEIAAISIFGSSVLVDVSGGRAAHRCFMGAIPENRRVGATGWMNNDE